MKAILPEIDGTPFTQEQSRYLNGFFSGLRNRGLSFDDAEPLAGPSPSSKKKLIPEEQIKADLHPLEAWADLRDKAKANESPTKEDVFRFKWNGLFWLAPLHEGYMCRLRIPGGKVTARQLAELADISDDLASGYLQLTTRNNLQVRVIQPKDAPELLRRLQDAGLQSRGSGADNLRNFTANPTAGVDPYEVIDVSPYVKELADFVLNSGRRFYDLPRKFNISFDGGGLIGVAEDTNDIGLKAIQLKDPDPSHPLYGRIKGGVWFRILLGGVTGHLYFAEDAGVICRAEVVVDVVIALTQVFINHGTRTNRNKARLIYLINEWGFDRYLDETQKLLKEISLVRFDPEKDEHARLIVPQGKPQVPHSHVGAFPQKQLGLNYLGVNVPVGILPSEQARELAQISEEYGDGEMRLTIFQNLILTGIPTAKLAEAKEAIFRLGLLTEPSLIRGGVAACTGSRYCKYAASDTKGHAMELVEFLEKHLKLDQPVNIHVTGCPHSCAQHYIGDVGLLACKVKEGDETVEGYHVFVGGGFGSNKKIGRQLFKSIAAGESLHRLVLALFLVYHEGRQKGETFQAYSNRLSAEEWIVLTEAKLTAAST